MKAEIIHTQLFYSPFSGTTQVNRCQKKSSSGLYDAMGDITDTPTIQLGATPTGLVRTHLPPPLIFTPDALPAATLPIYPGLGQA